MQRIFQHSKFPIYLTLFAAFTNSVSAGELSPPPGPVMGTMKTLVQIEPRIAVNEANTPGDAISMYKITQPGSYYLTGNIIGETGKNGIEIGEMFGGVTIDLMGFALVGWAGPPTSDGITVSAAGSHSTITILNGTISLWGGAGVDLGLSTWNSRLEGVLVTGCGGDGLSVAQYASVSNCGTYSNHGRGIVALAGCTISNCTALQNSGNGIDLGGWSTATKCTSSINGSHGFTGGGNNTITNCTSTFNTSDGFNVGASSIISGCVTSSNDGNGIQGTNFSTIKDCASYFNGQDGIQTGLHCIVAQCTANLNQGDGINVNSGCYISINNVSSNGFNGDGAGIHATSGRNRIEDNNCTNAERGIVVDAPGNIIVKNTCSGNTTDWDIAANNVYGPIIDRRTPSSPAVNGFSSGTSLASTDQNANFSY